MTVTPELERPKRRPSKGFDSDLERARAAGRKSQQVQRAKREAKAARLALAEQEIQTFLGIDCTGGNLGPAAKEAAALIIGRILSGRVNITDGRQAAALLGKCHEIARLEAGQVTELRGSVNLQVTDAEMRKRIAGAKQQASVSVVENRETGQVRDPHSAPSHADTPTPTVVELVDEDDHAQ